MRRHRADEDEPVGLPGGGTGEWPLPAGRDEPPVPPDGSDDLAPGDVWESGGPGSAAAAARGCLCPMLPNDPRAGLGVLIAPDCPVHRSQLD